MKTNWSKEEYQQYINSGTTPEENPKVDTKYQKEKIRQPALPKDALKIHKDMYSLLRFKEEQNDVIFIPGNIPSSKSSQRIVKIKSKKTNKTFTKLIPSKTVSKYIKEYKDIWISKAKDYKNIISKRNLQTPLYVGMYFIRKSAHRFDGNNATQLITDLMTKHHWHKDDDMINMTVLPLGFHKDKDNPGVYIFILKDKIKTDILNYI